MRFNKAFAVIQFGNVSSVDAGKETVLLTGVFFIEEVKREKDNAHSINVRSSTNLSFIEVIDNESKTTKTARYIKVPLYNFYIPPTNDSKS